MKAKGNMVAAAMFALALSGCGGGYVSGSGMNSSAAQPAAQEAAPAEASSTASPAAEASQPADATDNAAALRQDLEQYGIGEPQAVRNDATGNWRMQKVANGTPPSDYAVEYANAYMQDAGTGSLHWIINFSLGTTTSINKLPGMILVSTREYVDNEEHDANVLGSGALYSDQYFDTVTGAEISTAESPAQSSSQTQPSNATPAAASSQPPAQMAPATSTSAPEQAEGTVSQQNAVRAAQNYLSYTAFSRDGLIDQLKYEGFPDEDASYAADNCGADWNEQAAQKARSYLDMTAFSRSGLIQQLEYEGFTREQAEYGASAVGL